MLKARRPELIAAAVLLAVVLAFCGRAVFTGRALLPLDVLLLMLPWHNGAFHPTTPQNPLLDVIQQYYPWRVFAVDALKAGTIPLWNPFSYCGQPFVANGQSAIFYPLNLLFLLLPLPAAFTAGVVLHLFLSGLFSYLLLRRWQLGQAPALLGAVAYMLNGFVVGWLEYPAFGLWVITWLPALLLCFELGRATGRWFWYLLCGLAIGIQFLGGQLQLSVYLVITFLLYVVWRAVATKDRRQATRLVGWAGLALVIGLALAAVQLLPTLELAPLSARTPKTLAQAQQLALPWDHLIIYLVPNFFGNPAHYNYWGDFNISGTQINGRYPINFIETGAYVGVITLLLAWLAIRLWRKPAVGFLLALTVISLLLALGTPLYALFFYLVPGAKQLGGLARILVVGAFGLGGLAAFGLQRLLNRELPLAKWELPAFGGGALVALALLLAKYTPLFAQQSALNDNFLAQAGRCVLFLLLSLIIVALLARPEKSTPLQSKKKAQAPPRSWRPVVGALALALLVADLLWFGAGFNPATDPKLAFFPTQATDYLKSQAGSTRVTSYKPLDDAPQAALRWMLPNTPLAYGLRDVHGYDSLVPGQYTRLMGNTDWGYQGSWPAPDSPLVDLLGIKYVATTNDLKPPRWQLVKSAETTIYQNQTALPRAFWVGRSRRVPADQALELVQNGKVDFRHEVLLTGAPGADGLTLVLSQVRFVEDDLNHVKLATTTKAPGWLVLTDTGYPGWRVTVDNKPTAWEYANYAFRAVKLPTGSHEVAWAYQPASFRIGLYISLAALALVCSALGYWWTTQR